MDMQAATKKMAYPKMRDAGYTQVVGNSIGHTIWLFNIAMV
jgi:hypothetical protein